MRDDSQSIVDEKKEIIDGILEDYKDKLLQEQANRYYESLELSEEATLDEIKKQNRKLSLKYHPDRQNGKSGTEKEAAEEKSRLVNKAYEVLGDEMKRMKYDLCFLQGEEGVYLNRKKLSKVKKSGELVNEKFRKSVELILQDELKINNFTWEDLFELGKEI